MNQGKNVFVAFLLSLILFSCKKDELPVPAHDPGNVITASVNMDASYKWQLFYNLKTNTLVGQNLKTSWDLGFESAAAGFHVILNTSKAMFARNTGNTNFASVTDTTGFSSGKKWDEASGNLDSTAIGDWRGTNNVYIVDRGYNETGVHQGFQKIQFQNVDADKYTIHFSQLNGAGDITLEIEKDSNYNFSFLSFTTGNTVTVEPPKATWDIVFTQYTHIFYETTVTPYLVTGCLLNRYNTAAKSDSIHTFASIDLATIENEVFSQNINTIGYNWKIYTGGVYVTNTKMNFLIKDKEGFYYKLHFIDFYNESGVKGNPKWEYQKL